MRMMRALTDRLLTEKDKYLEYDKNISNKVLRDGCFQISETVKASDITSAFEELNVVWRHLYRLPYSEEELCRIGMHSLVGDAYFQAVLELRRLRYIDHIVYPPVGMCWEFLRGCVTVLLEAGFEISEEYYNAIFLIPDEEDKDDVYEETTTPEGELLYSTTITNNKRNIHRVYKNGYEEWWEYDEYGFNTHYRNSDGFEYFNEYENRKLRRYHDSRGYERLYDEYGVLRYYKAGFETIAEFNSHGKIIHLKSLDCKFEDWWEYNEDGKETMYRNNECTQYSEYKDGSLSYIKVVRNDGHVLEHWFEKGSCVRCEGDVTIVVRR